MPDSRVAVIVPTRNSAGTLGACLTSLGAQSMTCETLVVDNYSTDETRWIARRHEVRVVSGGPERSAQRNRGASLTKSEIVGFIDSDMVLSPEVVAEACRRIDEGAGAVIVPEVTVGESYWTRVRAFERSFYVGSDSVEAARFYRREVFEALEGFDEALTGPEDWDLTIRARGVTNIARIEEGIKHLEGRLSYREACAKKAYYAVGLRRFADKHGMEALWTASNRQYVRRPWTLLHPLGIGLVALKLGESLAVLWRLAWLERSRYPSMSPPSEIGKGRGE